MVDKAPRGRPPAAPTAVVSTRLPSAELALLQEAARAAQQREGKRVTAATYLRRVIREHLAASLADKAAA